MPESVVVNIQERKLSCNRTKEMRHTLKLAQLAILLLILAFMGSCKEDTSRTLLFVGSYTNKLPDKGIKVYDFDSKTGETQLLSEVDSLINSSFLRLSHNGKFLYSVLESQMEYNGKVAAFSIDSINGKIALLNTQDCGGRNPVHLELNKSDSHIVVSNYTDPGLSLFEIDSDGRLSSPAQTLTFQGSSIIEGRQEQAHIHASFFSPNDQYLFSQDLGSDKIHKSKVDYASGLLTKDGSIEVEPGNGPRHFEFHPNGKFAYGISELSGKVSYFKYSSNNLAFQEDHLAYSKTQSIYRSADIHISQDGLFLYVSNRGPEENTIAIFEINQDTGKLELIGHEPTYGDHPRNFAIDPSDNYLLVANQFSDKVTIFKRNKDTGKLTKIPEEIATEKPSSIQMRTYKTAK